MRRFLIGPLMLLCAATLLAQPAPVARPWLGMALGVRELPGGGTFLYVGQVGPDTPAAKAGVRAGDIVTHFGSRLKIGSNGWERAKKERAAAAH